MRATLLLALAGCSFVTTEGPRPPPGPTACNRNATPYVTDAIVGIAAALVAGIASIQPQARREDVLVPMAAAGAFGVSSGYGLVQVRRCRAEHVKRPAWSLEEMPAIM